MANLPLTGNTISSSYQGLLKSSDNTALGATEKPVVDGLGNASTLSMGTASASFTGTLDLSGATVTGLPAGSAGLVNGTGADSLQSDASLTTVPANAAGADSIALGDGATVAATAANGIAIGNSASSGPGIAIGAGVTTFSGGQAVSIGHFSDATANESAAYGYAAQATGTRSLALGSSSSASGLGAIAVGRSISATAAGAVGLNTNATIADTVSVKALEVQTDSTPTAGGIIMSDAGGTDRRINITATGGLQIDSTPVGGGGGDPFNPTTLTGTSQTLDLGSFNFFKSTLTDNTTLTFSNIPTDVEFQYSFSGSAPYGIADSTFIASDSILATGYEIQFNTDGTKLFTLADGTDEVREFTLSTAYDITTISGTFVSFSVASETNRPRTMVFSPDGTKMYIGAEIDKKAFEYTLSTAFDVTTATYTTNNISIGTAGQPWGMDIKPDGTEIYFIESGSNGPVTQYTLSTAYDLSTATLTSTFNTNVVGGRGLEFKPDGRKLYVLYENARVYEYDLSTPWDISTITYNGVFFSTENQISVIPEDVTFSDTGDKMYVVGNNIVYEYNSEGAPEVTLPASVQNPPTLPYSKDETVTYTFYTLDGGTTVYLSNSSVKPNITPGLVNGSAANSIASSSTLTINPAVANGTSSICIGDGSVTQKQFDLAIGYNVYVDGGSASGGVGIGKDITIGREAAVVIGKNLNQSVTVNDSFREVLIGSSGNIQGGDSVGIGNQIDINGTGTSRKIAIGYDATVNNAANGIALGAVTRVNASGAVALGAGVTASTVDTVTMKLLQIANYATIDFADDTAAAAGGIPLGGVYHTSGALKIRIV